MLNKVVAGITVPKRGKQTKHRPYQWLGRHGDGLCWRLRRVHAELCRKPSRDSCANAPRDVHPVFLIFIACEALDWLPEGSQAQQAAWGT